jgi:hypothetical protein
MKQIELQCYLIENHIVEFNFDAVIYFLSLPQSGEP